MRIGVGIGITFVRTGGSGGTPVALPLHVDRSDIAVDRSDLTVDSTEA